MTNFFQKMISVCDHRSKLIEMDLEDTVKRIAINLEKKSANIEFDENKISEKEIKSIITKLGYKVV